MVTGHRPIFCSPLKWLPPKSRCLEKEVGGVFVDEVGEAGVGERLAVEVEEEEGGGEWVEALPVDEAPLAEQPGLEQAPQLGVGGRAGHERVVLVAAGDVHVDLAVGLRGDLLVDAGVVAEELKQRYSLITATKMN